MKSTCRIEDVGRECSRCHTYKAWEGFAHGGGPRGRCSSCKVCAKTWAPRRKRQSGLRIDEAGRECGECKKYKTWDNFSLDKSRPQGRAVYCKSCHSVHRFKWNYNLTAAEYQKLHISQNGVCAVCGEGETAAGSGGQVRPLSVDHDHLTDRVRGLLCSKCTTAIGLMDDSVAKLSKAITYLSGRV